MPGDGLWRGGSAGAARERGIIGGGAMDGGAMGGKGGALTFLSFFFLSPFEASPDSFFLGFFSITVDSAASDLVKRQFMA